MIRKAAPADYGDILDLCEEFWTHTMFDEPFDRSHTMKMVNLANEHELLAVAISEGEIVGFAAGIKAPLLGSPEAMVGTELAWWVSPLCRGGTIGFKLLHFMEDLAKNAGIKYWSMVSMESSMPEQVNAMYERSGYIKSETTFTKVM